MPDTQTAAPANGTGEVDDAFRAALNQDAQTAPPEIPPPPRQTVSADPDAPHGRDEDGNPLTPYGTNKKTGLPNKTAGGPGRGHKERPRVQAPPKDAAGKVTTAAKADYSTGLATLGTSVWIGASAMQGGRLPLLGIKVPDFRP